MSSSLPNKLFYLFAFLLLFFVNSLNAEVEKSCDYRIFSVKINESVTIREVVNQFSDMCGFSVAIKDPYAASALREELNGFNIKDLTLREIFDILLEEHNLNYIYENNILRVSALQTKTYRLDYITSIRQGTAILNASVSAIPIEDGDRRDTATMSENEIRVSEEFDFWETLDSELTSILNSGVESYQAQSPIINRKAGLITITGTESQLKRAELYLDDLKERLHKQVMIDVSVISVELDSGHTTGIDWSKFELGINLDRDGNPLDPSTAFFQSTRDNTGKSWTKNINIVNNLTFSMEGLINFLKTNGETKVLSSPKVITMNNQQALITVGDNINYRVQEDTSRSDGDNITTTYNNYSVFIGVLLNLLPEISDHDDIMLRINPSISSFKYEEDDARQERVMAPDTTEKKLSTVAKVKSGDTIILGGLIENFTGLSNTKVPLLGDLPILGHAFKSTKNVSRSSELVFVITPRIIGAETKHVQTLKDLGFSKSIYE